MKTIRLLVVFAMILSLLTGCRTDDKTDSTDTSGATGTTGTTGATGTTSSDAGSRSGDLGFDMNR